MDKPVPLFVPSCSTNVPSNVPFMEQAESQRHQGLEGYFKTRVPFVPRFYTPLLELCVFYSVLVMCRRLFNFNSGGKNRGTNGTELVKTLSTPYIPRFTACSKKGTKNGTSMEQCSTHNGTIDGTVMEPEGTGIIECSKICSILFHGVPFSMEHTKDTCSNGYRPVFHACSICSMIFTPTVGMS